LFVGTAFPCPLPLHRPDRYPEDPGNARDLLALTATRLLDRLDFAQMTVDPTTYIAAEKRLEAMPARERQRWLELLSYTRALVYHDRERAEQDELREVIAASVRTDERRRQVETLFMTGAEALLESGRQQGSLRTARDLLLNLVRSKFGRVPRAVEKAIRSTDDLDQLNAWVIRAGMAATLEEAEIVPGSSSAS
jgi:hypothetical protein